MAVLHMSVIAQLEAMEAPEWAVFVAMHLPDPSARQAVVRDLLDRHGPAWADASGDKHKFLLDSIGLPSEWLAASLTAWAAYNRDYAGALTYGSPSIETSDVSAGHGTLKKPVASI
jgi:hypothetical protein